MPGRQRLLTTDDLQRLLIIGMDDDDLEHLTDHGLSRLSDLTDGGFDLLIRYLRTTDGQPGALYAESDHHAFSARGSGWA